MRSYIFTEKERTLIVDFLAGHIGVNDRSLHTILSRFRHFEDLAGDVDLYLDLRRRLAKAKAAAAA